MNKEDKITGIWRANSEFYKATYLILEEQGSLKAKVLSYDDGTTRYNSSKKRTWYQFNDLVENQGIYVDGISGATRKVSHDAADNVKVVDPDSLEVTRHVLGRPLKEKWIRVKQ